MPDLYPKNEPCVALFFTDALRLPRSLGDWVQPIESLKCARKFSSQQSFAPLACTSADFAPRVGPRMVVNRHTVGLWTFWKQHSSLITEADFFRLHRGLAKAESPPHHQVLFKYGSSARQAACIASRSKARHHAAMESAFSPDRLKILRHRMTCIFLEAARSLLTP